MQSTSLYQLVVTRKCQKLFVNFQLAYVDFADFYERALVCLQTDPYNRTRVHNIKKLTGVEKDGGQFRLRIGRWRFRYDIQENIVYLKVCGLRREDTYRV